MAVWHNVLVGAETGGGPALASCLVTLGDGSTVDIVRDVLHEAGGLAIQAAGRQTELQPSEPGVATLTVENHSGAYTPGRAASPRPLNLGLPIRYRETVGRRTFELFSGALNQPQATLAMVSSGAGDTVEVTAGDWVGQQASNPRRFVSNLGEWILHEGGDELVGYWPMVETTKPFLPAVNTSSSPQVSYDIYDSSDRPVAGDVAITPASTTMPIGEDAKIATVGGPLNSAGLPAYAYHLGVKYSGLTGPHIGTGQVLTVVAWRSPTLFAGEVQELLNVTLIDDPGGATNFLSLFSDTFGQLSVAALTGALTGEVIGSSLKTGRAYPLVIRWGYSPAVLEVWIDRTRYVGSLTGTPPANGGYVSSVDSGVFTTQGGFGHLQMYVGAPTDWTFDDYLAQIDHATDGLTGGLRWQRTDERVRQLARYAGLSDAQLDLDRGVAYMPRAALAGTTFTDQAARAVATEQGRLHVAGDGNLRFHNRIRARYNF